ncbi:unnamed protein product [Rotaria sp. Silwood2]|nr:unnamed protein product [Rotaria sp. Silwood2]CAF3143968.1 unnamed protein product [Rotaria sp. Silwood2]
METASSKHTVSISMVSTSSRVGKSMLIRFLKQTRFIAPTTYCSKDKYTFVKNKSVILRKISSKKEATVRQCTINSDLVLFIVPRTSTPNDHTIASLRHTAENKALFIIRTHFYETVNGTRRNAHSAVNEGETLENEHESLWSQYGEFLNSKNDIYLIGNNSKDKEKWDFERLKKDLMIKYTTRSQEQVNESVVENDVKILRIDVLIADPKLSSNLHPKADKNQVPLDREQQLFAEYFSTHGVDEIGPYLMSRLREWEQLSLNIAVTGKSGAGKSSFINAIREVKPNSPLAAKTGSTETTKEIKDYPHPQHKNLTFWDLPGVGTENFPRDRYLELIGFERFDAMIIICSERFTENDSWLAEQMIQMRKPFFFLRSKIDQDIKNDEEDSPPPFDERTVLQKIRADCLEQLPQCSHQRKVYLVSGRQKNLHRWDMDDFMRDLCQAYPELKRESFVFSMSAHCRAAVRLKVEYLRRRQWIVCSATAAAAILPVPALSTNVNLIACLTEAKEYRQQLGLCNEAVKRLVALKDTSSEYVRQTIDSILPALDDTTFEAVFKNCLSNRYATIVHCVPVLSSVRAVQIVTETLDYFLNLMEKVALILIDMHLIDIPSSPTTKTEHSDIEVIS